MIWLIMGVIVLGVLLYVAKPLYAKDAPKMKADSETAEYLEQIADIDARLKNADKSTDVSALELAEVELAKVELQRQVLAKSGAHKDTGPQTVLLSVLFTAIIFGTIGLYATLGRPDLARNQELAPDSLTLEQAVAQLEQKLAQGSQDPKGWMLYARSLMSLQRYGDAIIAYEKVLVLTDNSPQVLEELESAKSFILRKQAGTVPTAPSPPMSGPMPSPSKEQMQAAAAMTPEARQNMIKGMVEGLSQKLKDKPDDADGWTRLLKARKVLRQDTEALADIVLIRETFKDNPQLVEKILSDTGWVKD